MHEFVKEISHLLVPIDEAASYYACDVRGVISLALQGEIELLVPVTTSAYIGAKYFDLQNSIVVTLSESTTPVIIALDTVICNQIYLRQKAKILEFEKGYYISRGKLCETRPKINQKTNILNPVSWVQYTLENDNGSEVPKPEYEEITIGMLYIARDKCEKALEVIVDNYKKKDLYWLTSDLDVLARAANKFWNKNTVDLSNASTYPKTEDIINFFTDSGVKKTDAKLYARIIRPNKALLGARKLSEEELEKLAREKRIKITGGILTHRTW